MPHTAPATLSPRLKVPRHEQRPTQAPVPRVLAVMPSADELRAGVPLTRGAVRLFELLVRLAGDVARHRGHEVLPDAITYHVPQVGLAMVLQYVPRHLARLALELEGAGLIAFGAHAQSVRGRSLWDGTIWKLSLTPGHVPKIRADEYRHVWRPDFEADFYGKGGVKKELSKLSGLLPGQVDPEGAYSLLRARAAVFFEPCPPAVSSVDNRAGTGLDAVASQIRGLAHLHHSHRQNAITATATAIAQALNEPNRRAQWAGAIWAALRAHWEGRGDLEHMAAQVLRLRVDLTESAPWRSPGAVLMARLT